MESRVKPSGEQISWKERMGVRAERSVLGGGFKVEIGVGKTDGLEEL